MSADRAFFAADILLNIYSSADLSRQARARELFRECAGNGRILLSTQVVQEFYVAGASKLKIAVPVLRDAVLALLDLPLVEISREHIIEAIEAEQRHQISFRKALMVATAQSGGATILFTEDLSHGQKYGSVMVRNPFL